MGKITFIIGGARSGKSRQAVRLTDQKNEAPRASARGGSAFGGKARGFQKRNTERPLLIPLQLQRLKGAVFSPRMYKKIAFIATCQPLDEEMRRRIRMHKKNRPKSWKTFEEPIDMAARIKKIAAKFDIILIDCLTLWVSNLLLAESNESTIKKEIKKILSILRKIKADSIIVSNEVGLSIIPTNLLARNFRDIAGSVNQIVAKTADRVIFMVAGIPMEIKK